MAWVGFTQRPGSQLVQPLEGVPPGGAIVVHVTQGGSITPAIIDSAIATLKIANISTKNSVGPEVHRIEVDFLERTSPEGPLKRVVRAYSRTSAGTYVLIQ